VRLYIKLFLLAFAAIIIQREVLADGKGSELWFGIRCQIAYATDDQQLLDRLIEEAHDHDFGPRSRVNAAGG
jgi:hypothetical protein